jgi:predicted transcriptional regulator of viral defense system
MPRRAPNGDIPSWQRLYEAAAPQQGYFTAEQAADAGFSAQLLRYYAASGKVQHAGARGVYRMVLFPPGEHEDLVVAWLWSEQQGVMSHETALALHGISDALPAKIHMTVPAVWAKRRLRVPKNTVLHHRDVPAKARAWNGPVPVTMPLRTIEDCIADDVNPELVVDALRDAKRRGLITAEQAAGLRASRRRRAA